MLSTTLPEPVLVVTPVPPFATANVPARVTAPVVAVLGVRPVVPAENEDTPVPLIELWNELYHCVVDEALNSSKLLTGSEIAVFTAKASIVAPVAGKTFTALAPLLTITILLPCVAVGRVTPDGAVAAVVITLMSVVRAP